MASTNPSDLPIPHCTSCKDEFSDPTALIPVAGNETCKDYFDERIRPQFEAALLDEADYPVTVTRTELKILDYTQLLPGQLVQGYINKGEEYAILPKSRVHCAKSLDCGSFLGAAGKETTFVTCKQCQAATCLKCRSFSHAQAISTSHDCQAYQHPSKPPHHMLPEATRGQDWQICPGPGFKALVSLVEGCNHVICSFAACRTEFCFLCGEIVKNGGMGHFGFGMPCPKNGQPEGLDADVLEEEMPEVHPEVVAGRIAAAHERLDGVRFE